jgi:mycothiol synthase
MHKPTHEGATELPAAPANCPDLAFRFYRGEPDAPGMAAVHAARAHQDAIDPLSTCERIPTGEDVVRGLPARFDPARNVLVAEASGRIVAYTSIEWWTEQARPDRPGGTRVYLHLGYVAPDWRGRGVGTAMLRWAERRIRELAAEHVAPAAAAGSRGDGVVFAANASTTERDATALLRAEGYREAFRVVEFGMVDLRGLPEPGSPAGIKLRPAAPDHYRAVWDAIREAYAGGEHAGEPDDDDYRRFALAAQPALWRVAWCGDQVAGVALCAMARGRGEVRELSVRPAFRRRGVGRFLLISGLRTLREQGARQARLHTNADNPHRSYDLYESAGFRRLKDHVRYRKPLSS